MEPGQSVSGNGHANRPTVWRRCADGVNGLVRFYPFARDAALERLRRTGTKAFVRDLPMLVRMGFNYYRYVRPSHNGDSAEAPPPMAPYDAWLAVNQWTPAREQELRDRLAACTAALPRISILMPVYNPEVEFLDAAIASVMAQVYGDWELCIADDKSTNSAVQRKLAEWAARDKRIKVQFRPANGGVSVATNSAAESAKGEFVLLLDHDDVLTPDALGEVALYAAAHPTSDFIYSDNDKIDVTGRRYDPEFKPDYSPELLLSYMYFTHLCAIRRELYESIGGTRKGVEGCQDHDLSLRAVEKSRHVGHLPLVLYHWRSAPGSTAVNGAAKPNIFNAGRKTVQEALDRRGMKGKVYQPEWARLSRLGIYSAEFPDEGPSVAILIPTRNRVDVLKKCLKSLERTTYRNYEIVIVDNASDERATLEFLVKTRHRIVRIDLGGKFSFAALNNRAAEAVTAEYVLLLNNDTEVIEERWLSRMMGYAAEPGVGAVGARLLYPDGRVQHAGVVHGLHHGLAGHAFKLSSRYENGYLSHARLTRNYSAVTAACLLTRRNLFLEMGGLDDRDFAVAYNDVDYCCRLLDRGYRCVVAAGAELYHYEGLSRGFADNPAEVVAFRRRHGHRVDPYYNPNLSLEDEKFRVVPRRLIRSVPKRIRTCVFSHFLNFSGAPLIQYELTNAMQRNGVIEPIVACVPDGPLRQWYERDGAEVRVLGEHPLAPVLARPEEYDAAMETLGKKMRDEWKVDLVYANTLDTVFAVDAAHRVGLPVVWNVHESEGWRTYFGRYGYTIARKCLDCFPKPYRTIFGSDATRQVYASFNTAHNFMSLRNPLDLSRLRAASGKWTRESARRSLGLADGEFMVLTVGTICPRKGQMDLACVWGHLPKWQRKRTHIYLVGEPTQPYAHQVAGVASSAGSRFRMVAETSDVARYYLAADAFVCASRMECYPRVTQEAMAFGVPLITTTVFGLAEQVRDGVGGLHYQPGNMEQLALHLVELAGDAELCQRLSRQGPQVLEGLGSFSRAVDIFGQICREAYLFAALGNRN